MYDSIVKAVSKAYNNDTTSAMLACKQQLCELLWASCIVPANQLGSVVLQVEAQIEALSAGVTLASKALPELTEQQKASQVIGVIQGS